MERASNSVAFKKALKAAIGALLLLGLGVMPAAPQVQGGGLADLQRRVQALEEAVSDLRTNQGTLTTELRAGLDALQRLITGLNQELDTAAADFAPLRGQVAALEQALADLGNGRLLASYDQLASLPCTTAIGTAGTVNLVGLLKSPICAAAISATGRFIDLGLVVLDTRTNLMWEKKDQRGGLHDVTNAYSWCQVNGGSEHCSPAPSWIGEVNAEIFAGFSDWRLPTLEELQAIVDLSVAGCGLNSPIPCIDPIFGPTGDYYWSDWWVGSAIGDAVAVSFVSDGTWDLVNVAAVRAVRSGP